MIGSGCHALLKERRVNFHSRSRLGPSGSCSMSLNFWWMHSVIEPHLAQGTRCCNSSCVSLWLLTERFSVHNPSSENLFPLLRWSTPKGMLYVITEFYRTQIIIITEKRSLLCGSLEESVTYYGLGYCKELFNVLMLFVIRSLFIWNVLKAFALISNWALYIPEDELSSASRVEKLEYLLKISNSAKQKCMVYRHPI